MVKVSSHPSYYNVQFQKDIKEISKDTIKTVMIIPMIGRIYKPDKDKQGRYIDHTGVPDSRVMVMGAFDYIKKIMDEFYWVADNMDEVQNSLHEVPFVAEVL